MSAQSQRRTRPCACGPSDWTRSMANCLLRSWWMSVTTGRHDGWKMPRTITLRSMKSYANVWHIMASTSAFPSSSCATGMSGSSIAHSPSTTLISISASWCATSNSAVRATSSATTGSRISECRNKGSLVLDRKGITQRRRNCAIVH